MTDDTNSDLRRERLRRSGEYASLVRDAGPGAPALLGQVITASTTPGKFLKFHPVGVTGTAVEGGSPGFAIRSPTRLALFLGPGTALAGDYLVVKFVGYRWVCEKATGSGSGYSLPGCPCPVPGSLTMSVVRPDANFGMFQNATLGYGACPVTFSPPFPNGIYSSLSFVDGVTLDTFAYRFFCSGGYFCLSRVFQNSLYGSPFADAVLYRWLVPTAGNSCSPFSLTNGRVYSGGDPVSVVSISG